MQEEQLVEQPLLPFQRYAYALFLLTVVSYIMMNDFESAVINFNIALIFDPFDYRVPYSNRPMYQKVWLFVHAGLGITGFLYMIFF